LSRGSNVWTVHLTFALPSAVVSLLPPQLASIFLVRTCCQLVGGFPFAEIEIRWLWASGILLRRSLSVVVAEGSNSHIQTCVVRTTWPWYGRICRGELAVHSPPAQSGSTGLSVFLAGPAYDSRTIHLAFTLMPLLFLFFLLNHLQPSSLITLPCLLTLTHHSKVLDGFAVIGMMGMSWPQKA
jgi:hypothetical protein